ncbi:MAG: META domain-containing protein [Vicinamibacterales bacterium]
MTVRRRVWPALLAVVLLAGCGAETPPTDREAGDLSDLPPLAPPEPSTDPLANLPATFKGDLPNGSLQLNLFPDQTFFLRAMTPDRPGVPRDDLGGWVLSSDHRTLVVKGNRATEFFALRDGSTIRRLDADAKEIDGSTAYDLKRAGRFEPFEVSTPMRGAYVYMADNASFTECSSGRRWPVAQEGANEDLERAYLAARPSTGQPVVIQLEGRIAPRTRLDGTGTRPSLIVDHVAGVSKDQSCGQRYSSVPLEGTYWKLVRVGSHQVAAGASLTLDPASQSYAGSGGCNQVAGSYRRDGGRIAFTGAIRERSSCPSGMEVDEAFRTALTQVARWRVLGSILELQDLGGATLARFEAER